MSASTPREREKDNARSQQYQVIRVVGEGAYGMVLKCRNRATGDIVAIKKFRGNYDDPNLRRGMQREVKMLKILKRHPNIIRMYEAFKRKGRLHVAFEFFPRNLLDVLQQNAGGLKLSLVKYYICQLSSALKYCHSQNIIHRDIKPENILIDDEHRLKLCDFGFARTIAVNGDNLPGDMTDYVATRWYRPPELVLGFKQYDGSVDIWAMACILGELLDGQPLFPGENDVDQLHIIQTCCGRMTRDQLRRFFTDKRFAEIRVLPSTNPNSSLAGRYGEMLPPSGVAFMERCLKMDPVERPSGASCYDDAFFDDVRESLIAADDEFYRTVSEAEVLRQTQDMPFTPTTPAERNHSITSLTTPMRRLSLTSNPSPSPTPPLSPVQRPEGERRPSIRRGSDMSDGDFSRQSSANLTTPNQRGKSPQITNPNSSRSRHGGKQSDLSPKMKAGVKPVPVPVATPGKPPKAHGQRDSTPQKQRDGTPQKQRDSTPQKQRESTTQRQRDSTPQKHRAPKFSPSKQKRTPIVAAMPPPVGLPTYKHKPHDGEAMPATPTPITPRADNPKAVKALADPRTQPKKPNKHESIPDINSPLPPSLGLSLVVAAARRASRSMSLSDPIAAAAAFQMPIELLIAEPKGGPVSHARDDAQVQEAPQDMKRHHPGTAPAIHLLDDRLADPTTSGTPSHRRRSTYLAEGKPATPRVRSSHRPTRLNYQVKLHRHKSDDLAAVARTTAASVPTTATTGEHSPVFASSGDWDLLDDEAFETEDDVFERFHRHSNSFGSTVAQNGSTVPNWQEISPTAALLMTRMGLSRPPQLKSSHPQGTRHHKSRASVGNFRDFQSFFENNTAAIFAEDVDGAAGFEELQHIPSHVPKIPALQDPPNKSPERALRRTNASSDGLRHPQGFLSPQPTTGARTPRPTIQRVNSMPRHGLRPKAPLDQGSPQRQGAGKEAPQQTTENARA